MYYTAIIMGVRVRIAPSPTGFWHIGNTRTALYNFLFAKKMGGQFIFRLEDTDRERFLEEAVIDITQSIKWLGLEYDEGPDVGGPFEPYVQSERLKLYQQHAQQLLEKGVAYQEEGAIRFKTSKDGETHWHDLVGSKEISFDNRTQEDFVILKSDGYPTYNFANVIDDHYMEVTHVIRGAEFISSTPKHLMIYQAFSWQPPQFAHLPLILGTDRSKLSKRHGARPVSEFKKDGYLPEAILNYMALLGWTPPAGKEILSLEEMVKQFDLKDLNVANPVFDISKLDWMNGEYIRKLSDEELTRRLHDYLVDHPAKEIIAQAVPLIKERIKKLSDYVPLTLFLHEPVEYDRKVFERVVKDKSIDLTMILGSIVEKMEQMERPWRAEVFEDTFRQFAKDHDLQPIEVFQLIRVAVSGQLVTPPLFESIKLLGEEETLKRVKEVVQAYPNI